MHIDKINQWIEYGANRSWSPEVTKDTLDKTFGLNLSLKYIRKKMQYN